METLPSAPDENSSTSGRRNILKSGEGGSRQEGGRSSPPPNCAICLGRCRNKSFTDSCLHQFCFKCLVTWSKVKTECPLCKQTFKSIIHNVKSNHQYEEYQVEQPPPEDILDRIDLRGIVAATRRYRFRATLTMPRVDSVAFHRFLMSYPISTIVREGFPSDLGSHRRSRLSPAAFRRTIYRHNLWARPLPDFTGRFRDCSPEFYRYNDSQIHRLIPWLNRELHYLLNDNSGHITYVLARIIEILPQYHITSSEFREAMHRYFGDRTEHFLHELYCFASTPYDLTGYDRNIQYTSDPHSEVNQVISGSDSDDSVDSDIVMVSSSHPSERPPVPTASTSTAAAGPSRPPPQYCPHAADPSVIPIETISHSDTDDDSSEVMVVGYIRPPHQRTPEVVDLIASDSDVVVQETMPEPKPNAAAIAAAVFTDAVDLTSTPVDPADTTPPRSTAPAPGSVPAAPALGSVPAAPAPVPPRPTNMVKLKLTRPRAPVSDSDSDETYTPSPPPPPARRRRRARPKPKKTSRTVRKDRKKSNDGASGSRSDKRKSKNGRNIKSTRPTTPDDEPVAGPSGVAAPASASLTPSRRTRSNSSRGESPERKRLRSVVVKSTSSSHSNNPSRPRSSRSSSSSSSSSFSSAWSMGGSEAEDNERRRRRAMRRQAMQYSSDMLLPPTSTWCDLPPRRRQRTWSEDAARGLTPTAMVPCSAAPTATSESRTDTLRAPAETTSPPDSPLAATTSPPDSPLAAPFSSTSDSEDNIPLNLTCRRLKNLHE